VLAFDPEIPPPETIVFGLLGGVFGAVGLGSLYKGLAVGRMGIVSPIAALSVLVGVVAGLLQGDRPSDLQVAGMVGAIAGAVLAATAPEHGGGPRRVAEGVGYAVVAALALGATAVCIDAASEGSAVWTALLLRSSSVPLVALLVLITKPAWSGVRRRDVGVLAGVGVADNGANALFALATTKGLLTIVSVLGSLVPVVTTLLARFVLHERLTRHQVVGVVLALGGVALIATG